LDYADAPDYAHIRRILMGHATEADIQSVVYDWEVR
jgi:hypothetical protein